MVTSELPQRPDPELVSVVIPVLNGESVLSEQLAALEMQTYSGNWEILVVDNGSSDRTVDVALGWSDRLPIRIIDASGQSGISYARNQGLKSAHGQLIAFCDSDDVASPGWLAGLTQASRSYDCVEGRLDFHLLNRDLADSIGSPSRLPLARFGGFLPFASGANFCVWRDVADDLGGWRTDYEYGADDVEFSFRLQLSGYTLGHCETAVMHYRLRKDLSAFARQVYKYGVSQAQVYSDFRSFGMPRSDLRRVLKTWVWLFVNGPRVFRDSIERRRWVRILAQSSGRLSGSVRHRVLYF